MGGVSEKCKAGYDGSTYDQDGICPTILTTVITGSKLFVLVKDGCEFNHK